MWNLGSVLGSALGGFTAQPAKFYPQYFSQTGLFGQFPYLLPNLISAVTFAIAIVQAAFLLEETLQPEQNQSVTHETSSLIHGQGIHQPVAADSSTRRHRRLSFVSGSPPIPYEPYLSISRESTYRSTENPTSMDKASFSSKTTIMAQGSEDTKAFTNLVTLWIIALVLMSCHQVSFGSILPVFVVDAPRSKPGYLDLIGGLGLTLHDVGTFLAVISVISLFPQGIMFPAALSWLEVWKSAICFTTVCPIFYVVEPFVSLMSDTKIGVYAILISQTIATVIIYPCLLILLKDATASPRVLAGVNGVAMSACSAARTVTPPLVGIVYSTIGSVGAWACCATMAILASIELFFVSRPRGNLEESPSGTQQDIDGAAS